MDQEIVQLIEASNLLRRMRFTGNAISKCLNFHQSYYANKNGNLMQLPKFDLLSMMSSYLEEKQIFKHRTRLNIKHFNIIDMVDFDNSEDLEVFLNIRNYILIVLGFHTSYSQSSLCTILLH